MSHFQLWLTLAEQHLLRIGVDWTEAERNCFNDRINPEDEDLGAQIVRVNQLCCADGADPLSFFFIAPKDRKEKELLQSAPVMVGRIDEDPPRLLPRL